MTKLNYQKDGIYKYCKDSLSNCSNNLKNAKYNCSFDIPTNFVYRSYLNSLDSTINQYCKEVDNIDYKLKKTNDNFESLEMELSSEINKMSFNKVKEHDRLIY